MTSVTLHSTPSAAAVFRAHFTMLYYALRRERWIAAMAIALTVFASIGVVANTLKPIHDVVYAKRSPDVMAPCLKALRGSGRGVNLSTQRWQKTVSPAGVTVNLSTSQDTLINVTNAKGEPVAICSTNPEQSRAFSSAFGNQLTATTDPLNSIREAFEEPAARAKRLWYCVVAFAFVAALTIRMWRGDAVNRRTYFLTMPVHRGEHAVLKFLAGWCWLAIAIVLVIGTHVLIDLIVQAMYVNSGLVSSVDWLRGFMDKSAVEWFGYWTVLTICYLLVSALAVAFNSPGYWLAGFPVALLILPFALTKASLDKVADLITAIWSARYGMEHIIPVFVNVQKDTERWWGTTGIWFGIGLAAFLLAAYARRPAMARSA